MRDFVFHHPWRRGAFAGLAIAAGMCFVEAAGTEISATVVQRPGNTWEAVLSARAALDPKAAWLVLTDFNHQAAFIPNIIVSREISAAPDLRVEQVGEIRFMWWRIRRRAVFAVQANQAAGTLDLHAVQGDFRRFDQHWRLTPVVGGIQLHYEAAVAPKGWIPNWVAQSRIRKNAVASMQALLQEIRRR
jgi:hypothetical protein